MTTLIKILTSIVLLFSALIVSADTLQVAVKHSPPFLFVEGNNVSGINANLFSIIADELQVDYEYVSYKSVDSIVSAVSAEKVDVAIAPLSVTSERYANMSFSQPTHIGGLGVVMKTEPSAFLALVSAVFSWDFFKALFLLVLVLFVFGFLLWLTERRTNKLQFRPGFKGLLDGMWWSAVTMTTVGYGDKSPTTIPGRIIAIIWMFTAVVTISSFTAGIASSLTVNKLDSDISKATDLQGKRVGSIMSSSSAQFLEDRFVSFTDYITVSEMLNALLEGEIDYVVYDYIILKHYLNSDVKYKGLFLPNTEISSQYYSFAFARSLPLQDKINYELMHVLESDEWQKVVEQIK